MRNNDELLARFKANCEAAQAMVAKEEQGYLRPVV